MFIRTLEQLKGMGRVKSLVNDTTRSARRAAQPVAQSATARHTSKGRRMSPS